MEHDADRKSRGLVLSGDPSVGRRTSRVARCAADDVDVAEVDTEPERFEVPAYDFVVVNAPADGEERQRRILEHFEPQRRTQRLLFHGCGLDREGYASLFEDFHVGNVLACGSQIRKKEMFATLRKMVRGEIFGLDKYLSWGAQYRSDELRSNDSIESVVEQAHEFVSEIGMPGRLAEQFSRITGEFLTNALYHAPSAGTDAPEAAEPAPTEDVELEEDRAVRVNFGRDGERIGISVTDPFGSLTAETLFEYLGRCFRKPRERMRWDTPGAGLGLYQAFQGLSHLVVNLDPGRKTEVIGLMNIRASYADFAAEGNSFNLFQRRRR